MPYETTQSLIDVRPLTPVIGAEVRGVIRRAFSLDPECDRDVGQSSHCTRRPDRLRILRSAPHRPAHHGGRRTTVRTGRFPLGTTRG